MVPRQAPLIAAFDTMGFVTDPSYRERLGMSAGASYFNAGVMVLDLKAVRSERIFRDAIRYATTHPENCLYVDQDALNSVINGRWQVLDWRWNVTSCYHQSKSPFIRHFIGKPKPWAADKSEIEQIYTDQWRADLAESPWPDRFEEAVKTTPRRPFARVDNFFRRTLFKGAPGRRGNKVRMSLRYAAIQAALEEAAASEQIAPKFQERALEP